MREASLVLTSLSISYLAVLEEGSIFFLTRNILNKVGEGLVFLTRFGKDEFALLVLCGSVGVPDNVEAMIRTHARRKIRDLRGA